MENYKAMERNSASALDKMMNEKVETKFIKFRKKMHKTDKLTGTKLHRVKPSSDPFDAEGTKWMSTLQLEGQALEPSRNWIDAGSGNTDRIFIEIIGCDDLPNLVCIDLFETIRIPYIALQTHILICHFFYGVSISM